MLAEHAFLGSWHAFVVGACFGLLGLCILFWDRRDLRVPIPRTRHAVVPGGEPNGRTATVPTPNGRPRAPEGTGPPQGTNVRVRSLGSAHMDPASDHGPVGSVPGAYRHRRHPVAVAGTR